MKRFLNVVLCGLLAAVMVVPSGGLFVPSGGLECYKVGSVLQVRMVRIGKKMMPIPRLINVPKFICAWRR